MNKFSILNKKRGFTVIELLIVIAIIALLSSVILVATRSSKDKASIAKVLQYSASVKNVLGAYIVGEWRFSEGSGTAVADSSGNGNNGTWQGSGPHWVANTISELGKAGQFDSATSDSVAVPDSTSLDTVFGQKIFTLEAWVYPKDWTNFRGIISKINSPLYNNQPVGLFADATGFRLVMGPPINTISYLASLNEWHHVVGTANSSQLKLYVDGGLRGSVNITAVPVSNNDQLNIGYFWGQFRFNGFIDEVRIYSESLDLTQIQKLYAEGAKRHGIVLDK